MEVGDGIRGVCGEHGGVPSVDGGGNRREELPMDEVVQ